MASNTDDVFTGVVREEVAPGLDRWPPSEDELPCDDGIPMETARHRQQMELLIQPLQPWLDRRGDGYAGGNMFVYFSPDQSREYDFRGPDVFVALNVSQRERKSWVSWAEGKGPDVVIELLSPSTARLDKTEKKLIYQDRLRVPECYWFDPFNPDDFAGFRLQGGRYEPIESTIDGQLPSASLGLNLSRWQGVYSGVETHWLRWVYPEGSLLPTPEEIAEQEKQRAEQERQRAEQERQRAEQERQRAEQERQRADKLAAKLRAAGIDPDTL